MESLSDNEKAAIAAGLWKPGQEIGDDHPIITPAKKRELADKFNVYAEQPAPDMHDPVNLFDAREISRKFRALVAKYDAEHPE